MKALLLTLMASGLCTSSALAADLGEECELTSDCSVGLACEVVGGSDCVCASGPDGEASCEPCEATEQRACVPGPCQGDSDCGDGFVCVTFEVPCATSTPACDPDSNCVEPEPVDCEEQTRSVCAPRWVLPCEDDAACGEGFTCETDEVCACSGSGGSDDPSSGGGDSEFAPREQEECDCQPSEDKSCHPLEIECDGDAQCPEGWSCEQGDTATSVPCALPENGSEPNCEPSEPVEPGPGHCHPPGGVYGDGDSRDLGEELGIPTNAQHDDDGGAPLDPQAGSTTEPSSGCNAAGGSLLLALFALAFVVRRRAA